MHRFWTRYIGPVIDTVQPQRILEIGAEHGANTRQILGYCRRTGSKADIVDPVALPELKAVLAAYPDTHMYHARKSIDVISTLVAPDVALIDGDHNWRTVYTELTLLMTRASTVGAKFPVVLAHDCAWPYARRDMYYAPEEIDPAERHPYAYRGILPGNPLLADNGINGHLANALQEGGPQNGVLTAIEDFVASAPTEMKLYTLPFFNGLGIVVPAVRMTAELNGLIDGFYSGEAMLESCMAVEKDAMWVRAELFENQSLLTKRSEALARARSLLAAKNERLRELEAELAALRQAGQVK